MSSRNFSKVFPRAKHTAQLSVEKRKIYCHPKKKEINSSNQLFSIFFSKNVTFTKFLSEKCDSEFPLLLHMDFTKFLYHDFLKNFRENNFFCKEFTIQLISQNNFQVIQKFSKHHSVCCAQCWNYGTLLSCFFGKKFVKATHLLHK